MGEGKKIVYAMLIEACITWILNLNGMLGQDLFTMCFILVNTIIVFAVLSISNIPRWLYILMFFSYGIKILWLIFMYFNIDTMIELFKQRDAIYFFHPQAMEFLSDPNAPGIQFYSKVVALIYAVFGETMRIPVYFNILCSLYAEIFFFRTLCLLELREQSVILFTSLYMLIPWKALMSVYMQREAIPTFFIVLAVYYFVNWIKFTNKRQFIYSLLSIVCALPFHAGLIPILVVYCGVYILYDRKLKSLSLSRKVLFRFLIIGFVVGILFVMAGNILVEKLLIVDLSSDAIVEWSIRWTEEVDTGSIYLTWLQYRDLTDLIWQSPIRMVYFLFSPMPWDWRGLQDVIAFAIESMTQLSCIVYVIKNFKFVRKEKKLLLKILLVSFFSTALLFGVGTFESGTAMRHREKFVAIILIVTAVIHSEKTQIRIGE